MALKINFLGDSITEGHGCAEPEHFFVNRIARDHGVVCRNYGIGGSRIARQKKPSENPRHDLDFVGRFAEMDPDADVIVVFGGTNDFGHGDAPMGVMEDRTPDTFYGALHTLYAGLIGRYPEARIVILTPLHRLEEDNPRGTCGKPEPVGRLIDYVRAIRQVAETDLSDIQGNYEESMDQFIQDEFIDGIVDAVNSFNIEDMVNMAESLVSVTNLQRHISSSEESVGGPIDVAVITRSEGFMWVKHKHWMPQDADTFPLE